MVKSQKPDLRFQNQTTASSITSIITPNITPSVTPNTAPNTSSSTSPSIDSVVLERLWHMIPDDARLENHVLPTSGFSSKTMSECAYMISNDYQESERSVANAGKKLVSFLFPDTTFECSLNEEGALVKSAKKTIDPNHTMTFNMANGEAVFDERTGFYNLFSDKEHEVAKFLQVFQARLALAVTKEESIAEIKEFQRITHLPFEVLEYFYEKVKHRSIGELFTSPEITYGIPEIINGILGIYHLISHGKSLDENIDRDFCYHVGIDYLTEFKRRRFGYGFWADDESLFSKIPQKIINGILVEGAEEALKRQKKKLDRRLNEMELWPSMRYGTAIDTERISTDDKVIDFFHDLQLGVDFLLYMTPDNRMEERYELKKRQLVMEYKEFCRKVTMSPLIFTHYVYPYIYFCYLTNDREALKEMVSVYLDIFQQNRIIERHEWSKLYQGAARNLFEADVWDGKDLDLVKTLLFSWNALKEVNKIHELLKTDKIGSNTQERTDGSSHYNSEEKDALVERIRKVLIEDIIKDHVLKKLPSVFEKGTIELDNFDYLFVLSPLLGVLGDPELDYCVLGAIAKQADLHPTKLLMAEMYASNILGRYFYLPNEPTKQVDSKESPLSILFSITSPKRRLTSEQLTYWQQRFIDLFKPISERDAASSNGFKSAIDRTEERSKLEVKNKHNDNNDTNDDANDDAWRIYPIWGGAFLGDYVYYHENQRRYAQAHLERYDIISARRHFAAIGEKADYFGLTAKMIDDLAGPTKKPLGKTKILNLVRSCTLLRGFVGGHKTMMREWFSERIDDETVFSEEIINMKYNSKKQFCKYLDEKTKAEEEIEEDIFEKIMEYASRFYDENILIAGGKYLLSRNQELFPWLRDFWPNFSNISVLRDNEDALCIDEMAEEEKEAVEGGVVGGIAKILSKLKEEAVAFIEKKEYASAHMIYRKINPKKGNQEFLREVYSRNLQEVRADDKNDGTIGLTFVDDKGRETKITFHTQSLAGFGSIGVAKHSITVNHDGESKKGRRVIVTKTNDDERITRIEYKIYNELRSVNLFNVAKPLAVNGREIVVEYSGQTLVEYAQRYIRELAQNPNLNPNINSQLNPNPHLNLNPNPHLNQNPNLTPNQTPDVTPNIELKKYIHYLADAISQKVKINQLLSSILSYDDKAYLEERRIKKVLDYFKGRYSEREINEQYHAFRVMRAFGFDNELFRAAYMRTIGKALNAIPEKYRSWLKDSYGANFAVDDSENFTIDNNGTKNGTKGSSGKADEQEANSWNNRVIVFDFNNLTYDASQLDDSILIHTYGLGLTDKGEEQMLDECMLAMNLGEHEFGDVTDKRCEYKRGFISASMHRNLLLAGNILRAVESGRAPEERTADVEHHIRKSMSYIQKFKEVLGQEYNVDKEDLVYIIKTVQKMCATYFERIEHKKTERESTKRGSIIRESTEGESTMGRSIEGEIIMREGSCGYSQGIVSESNISNLGSSGTSSGSTHNLESTLGFSE
ncbi:hypothetical protein HY636_03765 [Candidatus Woesearchaeota archaeon]|nr:hypothetical protein [Candidatus Woesearchaeota archaeon]